MATPFAHTYVTHVSKTGRRRSKSVTLPKTDQDDTQRQNIEHKQFFAQLRKERQKQQNNGNEQIEDLDEQQQQQQQQNEEDLHHPVVSRVPGANDIRSRNNTLSTGTILLPLRQQLSSATYISDPEDDENEQHQSVVTRVVRAPTTIATKKSRPFTAAVSITSRNEIISSTSHSKSSQENEQHYKNYPQIVRVPRSLSTMSLKKSIPTTVGKSSNVNVYPTSKDSNLDSLSTLKGIGFNSSQLSSHPLLSSSTNLMSKSEIFDRKFYADDNKDHTRRNDGKRRGTISISGKETSHHKFDKKSHTRSSASFMIAVIGMVIALIAFVVALTSLILILLLRSTVYNTLGGNSTSSGSSSTNTGDWPASCSNYTTVDDPTRHVFAPGYSLGCDNSAPFINRTAPVWIRFVGTGGTTLPLQTPGMDLCGTQGTGWYDGEMPSTPGQIANGTACFTWYNSVCRFSQSISVANCGSFYIYLLPPAPACMMRYCTI